MAVIPGVPVRRTAWPALAAALTLLVAARGAPAQDDPGGLELAFITPENQIRVMEVFEDGTGPLKTVETPKGEPDRLVAAPVGRRLAFLFRDAGDFKQYLWVHDLETGESRKLAGLKFRSPCDPAFSPDGKFVCFVDNAEAEGKHVVKMVSVDGKKTLEVFEGDKVWDGPVFADAGTILTGSVLDDVYRQRLTSWSVMGGRSKVLLESVELPPDKAAKRSKPNFSPVAVDVVIPARRVFWLDWGKEDPTIMQIRETNTAGQGGRWITECERNVFTFRVSPDGKWIAFLCEGEKLGSDDLFSMSSRGGKPRHLATINKQPYRGWMFSWAPDSRRVVYVHNPSKDPGSMRELFLVDVVEGEPQQITFNQLCECYPVFVGWGQATKKKGKE